MTGYVFILGPCICCGVPFMYNPMRVPSLRINGVREPVCEACIKFANPRRIANNLDPIQPHPEAYGPCREDELGAAEEDQ